MVAVIDFGSPKIHHIAESINMLDHTCRIVSWEEGPEIIGSENVKAIILSGSPLLISQTDITPHLKRYDFIKTTTLPVLGICYGHQLLGILHGGNFFKGEEVRQETEIRILNTENLFAGFGQQVKMIEDHTEGIILPAGFIHLASSEKYEVESMKHPDKNIFGVQFHPEVSGENGLKLLSNFLKTT